MTLELEPARASLPDVMHRLALSADEIDLDFGLVNIDPDRHLYTILVDESVAPRLATEPGVSGPYANPPIEPYGPPEESDQKKT